jgi:hypothetical protein
MVALDLKKNLQTNIAKLLTLTKRGPAYPETDYQTKQATGKQIYLYIFTDESGQELKYYANEREEETLNLFHPGERVQVVRQETMKEDKRIAFQSWSFPEGVEARLAANPPAKSNVQLATQQRNLDKNKQEETNKWDKIAIGKCIHNFMLSAMEQGKSIEDAAIIAYKALGLQEQQTEAYISDHRTL